MLKLWLVWKVLISTNLELPGTNPINIFFLTYLFSLKVLLDEWQVVTQRMIETFLSNCERSTCLTLHFAVIELYERKTQCRRILWLLVLPGSLAQWFPTTASGTTSAAWRFIKRSPKKSNLILKVGLFFRIRELLFNFIIWCSPNFKKSGC